MIGKIVTQVPSGTFEVPLISHFRLLGSKGITMSHGVHMSRKIMIFPLLLHSYTCHRHKPCNTYGISCVQIL